MYGKSRKVIAAALIMCTITAMPVFAASKGRLSTPRNVKAKASGERSIDVSWKAVSGADSYSIAVKNKKTNAQLTLKFTSKKKSGTLKARVKGLDYNTKYEVKVKAKAKGRKTSLASKSAKTQTKVIQPAKPNVKLTSKTDTSFTISWNKVKNADGYGIWRDLNGTRTQIADVKGTSYSQSNLQSGSWKLVVRAYRTRGGKTMRSQRAYVNFTIDGRYSSLQYLASTIDDSSPYSSGSGNPNRIYSREQAEAYVNYGDGGSPFPSGTNRLIWINLSSYRLFAFYWDGAYWRLENSWPCIIGGGSNRTQQGRYVLSQLSPYHSYGYNHAVYLTSYAGENAIHSLLYPSQADSLSAGYMASLGCVRVVSSAAQYIYENFAGSACIIM